MFIQVTTKKGEKILMNVNNVVFVSPAKNGSVIIDVSGMDYSVIDTYESVVSRLDVNQCD